MRHTPIWKKPFVRADDDPHQARLPPAFCMSTGGDDGDAVAPVWIMLSPPVLSAPRLPRTPPRPSQVVHESTALTTGKQHILVRLERTSTGGTRREAQFTRAARGAMTCAERAQKKRVRASLFPQQQSAARARHAEQNRLARPRRKEKAELQVQADIDAANAALDAEILATGGYISVAGFVRVDAERVRRAAASTQRRNSE